MYTYYNMQGMGALGEPQIFQLQYYYIKQNPPAYLVYSLDYRVACVSILLWSRRRSHTFEYTVFYNLKPLRDIWLISVGRYRLIDFWLQSQMFWFSQRNGFWEVVNVINNIRWSADWNSCADGWVVLEVIVTQCPISRYLCEWLLCHPTTMSCSPPMCIYIE